MIRTYKPNGKRERARRMRQGVYFKWLFAQWYQKGWPPELARELQSDGWEFMVSYDAWEHPTGVVIPHSEMIEHYARLSTRLWVKT